MVSWELVMHVVMCFASNIGSFGIVVLVKSCVACIRAKWSMIVLRKSPAELVGTVGAPIPAVATVICPLGAYH